MRWPSRRATCRSERARCDECDWGVRACVCQTAWTFFRANWLGGVEMARVALRYSCKTSSAPCIKAAASSQTCKQRYVAGVSRLNTAGGGGGGLLEQ